MTISVVLADADDRHVLAAALSTDAGILLTENTKHFPRGWMAEHGIELLGAAKTVTWNDVRAKRPVDDAAAAENVARMEAEERAQLTSE